jgi:DNA polymerase III subunit epsilon
MSALLGTQRQIAWARDIQRRARLAYPDAPLPDQSFASFWIANRDAPPDVLSERAQDVDGPFTFTYPRYGRREALAVLDLLTAGPYLVLDCETTGIGKGHEITEIAVVSGQDGEVLLNTLVQPADIEGYASGEAARITGITADALRAAPQLAEIWPLISKLLTAVRPGAIVAYNASFDLPMIRRSARRYGLDVPPPRATCAMRLYSAWAEADDWYTLDEAAALVGIDRTTYGPTHTALADALTTAELIRRMHEQREGSKP